MLFLGSLFMNSIIMPIIFRVYRLFNFFYRKVYPKPAVVHAVAEQLKKETATTNSGDGVFSFHGYGFSIKIGQEKPIVFWAEVDALFAYTENRSGMDCICLDVFYRNGECFKVSEFTPGWLRFLDSLAAHFPTLDKNWQQTVAANQPTLLYEKKKRSQEEAQNIYYTKEK